MGSVKKIMVPIAFSQFSKAMLEYAAELAGAFDAELLLVHVINERDIEAVQRITSYGYNVDEEHYIQEVEKNRIAQLEEMIAGIDFPEEKITFKFKIGRPADVLLKMTVKEKVDMVVMGIKAKSELIHAFTGSVAEKMFRRCPVTLVSYRDELNADKLRKRLEH